MSKNSDRPHVVNHEDEIVYLSVRSFMGALSAPHWANHYYPGYKYEIVSEEKLATIKEND